MLNIRRQIIVVLKAWRNWKIKIKLYWSKYKKVDEDNIIPSNFNKQHNNKCKILQKISRLSIILSENTYIGQSS